MDDLLLAVAAGAYLNGLAGEIAAREIPPVSMIAGDTVRAIPEAVKEILERNGYKDVRITKDYAGNDRVVTGIKL